MTSVYNLLREACGISQAEAAERVHETRLDTVKSWSSDRRPAPGWAINQLQALSRGIHKAGEDLATMLMKSSKGNVYVIGLPHDEEDARACGFPSSAAHHQAIAIAISLLPDDAEIRMTPRVRGSIPAPVLERERPRPTDTDLKNLRSNNFKPAGLRTPAGMNTRHFERLEEIGWIKAWPGENGETVYHLEPAGEEAQRIKIGDLFRVTDDSGAERLLQVVGYAQPQRGMFTTMPRFEVIDIQNPAAERFQVSEIQLRGKWTPA
jgi:hypothetical protein